MAGKSVRNIKLSGVSAIGAIVAGSLLLFGAWFTTGHVLNSNPESTPNALITPLDKELTPSQPSPPPVPTSSPSLVQNSNSTAQSVGNQDPKPSSLTSQGQLRVGNLSEHPVRLALLLKKPGRSQDSNQGTTYEPPAHWDFAPSEGRANGLVLSLPNRPLKLKQGDILVAFAQDGSRRYWGPYVVGETPMPRWNAIPAEWQLSLEP